MVVDAYWSEVGAPIYVSPGKNSPTKALVDTILEAKSGSAFTFGAVAALFEAAEMPFLS